MKLLDNGLIEIQANSERGFDNGQIIHMPVSWLIETSFADMSEDLRYKKIRYFLTIRKNDDPANWKFYDIKINKKEYEAITNFLERRKSLPTRPVRSAIYELEVNER